MSSSSGAIAEAQATCEGRSEGEGEERRSGRREEEREKRGGEGEERSGGEGEETRLREVAGTKARLRKREKGTETRAMLDARSLVVLLSRSNLSFSLFLSLSFSLSLSCARSRPRCRCCAREQLHDRETSRATRREQKRAPQPRDEYVEPFFRGKNSLKKKLSLSKLFFPPLSHLQPSPMPYMVFATPTSYNTSAPASLRALTWGVGRHAHAGASPTPGSRASHFSARLSGGVGPSGRSPLSIFYLGMLRPRTAHFSRKHT